MTRKTETEPMLRGHAPHRAAVAKAKDGGAQGRAFLAVYLVGKPQHDAPEPQAVAAARIADDDTLADKVTDGATDWRMDNDQKDAIREAIAAELPAHIEPQP